VLAYAATGHGPFDSASVPAIIHRIVTEPPDLGSISGPLRDVIGACLAKNPADRPALGYLLGVMADVPGQFAPVRQPPVPVSPGKAGWFSARHVALGGGFAAVLAMAVVLGVVLGTHGNTSSQAGTTSTASSHKPGSGRPSASGAPSSTGTSTTAAPLTATTVCTLPADSCTGSNVGALQTEPSEIAVSADGSGYIKDLAWSGWGTGTAKGTGTLEVDDCSPNCAQGHDTPYAATVTLTHLAAYGNGEQAYSAIALSVPSAPRLAETFSTRLVP
jgi:hypothetical protein